MLYVFSELEDPRDVLPWRPKNSLSLITAQGPNKPGPPKTVVLKKRAPSNKAGVNQLFVLDINPFINVHLRTSMGCVLGP